MNTPVTALLYGQTRSGKTHCFMTMRSRGRVVVADFDGQVAAEAPDAHTVRLPAALPPDATAEQTAARTEKRDAALAEAAKAPVVIWPCFTVRDMHTLNAALQADRLGSFAGGTYALDSATFMNDSLIADICGVTVVRERDTGNVEAFDPVMQALPDFTGANVHRSMEMKDWQRFAQKSNEILVGTMALCRQKSMSFVATALEERREIYSGEGRARKFIRLAQGPLFRGQVSAHDIPPKFMLFFRLAARFDEPTQAMRYAAFTAPVDGWPAGVRGAVGLPPVIPNPNLPDIITEAGL